MPQTVDPLTCVEQYHRSAVQARKRNEFDAAFDHNQAALDALPADGTLSRAEHTEWLQRLVEERTLIIDAAAKQAWVRERELADAEREKAWAEWSRASDSVPRAFRQARMLLIFTVVVCCLAVVMVEFAVHLATS